MLDSILDAGQIKQTCHLTNKLPGACLHFRNKQATNKHLFAIVISEGLGRCCGWKLEGRASFT